MQSGLCSKAIFLIVVMFIVNIYSFEDMSNNSLQKKTVSITKYSNDVTNFEFTCPSGWVITDTTLFLNNYEGNTCVILELSNPKYYAKLQIYTSKHSSRFNAFSSASFNSFALLAQATKNSNISYGPYIMLVLDTVLNSIKSQELVMLEMKGENSFGDGYTISKEVYDVYSYELILKSPYDEFINNGGLEQSVWYAMKFKNKSNISLSKAKSTSIKTEKIKQMILNNNLIIYKSGQNYNLIGKVINESIAKHFRINTNLKKQ